MSEVIKAYKRFYFPYNRKYFPRMEDPDRAPIDEEELKEWTAGKWITERSDGHLGEQGNLIFEGDILMYSGSFYVVHYHDRIGTFVTFDDLEWLTPDVIEAAKEHPRVARRVKPMLVEELLQYPAETFKTSSVHLMLFYCNINPRQEPDFTKWKNLPIRPKDAWLYFHKDRRFVYPLADAAYMDGEDNELA